MKRGFVLGYKYYNDVQEALRSGLVGVYSQKQFLYAAMCKLHGWSEDQEIEDAFLPSGKKLNYRKLCDETRLSPTKRLIVTAADGTTMFTIWEVPINMQPTPGEGDEWWYHWQLANKAAPPSHWDDDEDYPAEDWQFEVTNGDTRQSYRQWVSSKKEEADV